MNHTVPLPSARRRLLVAIASYGVKNLPFLRRIIENYRRMPLDVDVVVVSEAPKTLGPDVRVVVGLPSKNPWSLPFAHKRIFAEMVDKYDLFAYSEDDIEVTADHIDAFTRVTPSLASDEIAGFLRYEVSASGAWSLPDVHYAYHWKAHSVRRRGAETIAEFTNDHSAFYLLTQSQLRAAIASGGFLRAPHEGRYDMLCSAATDPYANCGFRKVICVSSIARFLVHHLPDRYVDEFNFPLSALREQIRVQMAIATGTHPATSLLGPTREIPDGQWSKNYYEAPTPEVLSLVPERASRILSVGCGWGATEAALKERGARVTVIPLDSIVGGLAQQRGLEVVYGTLNAAMAALAGRTFDCVVIPHLLHLVPHPEAVVTRCADLVHRGGGALVVTGPNFDTPPELLARLLPHRPRPSHRFPSEAIRTLQPSALARPLREAGLVVSGIRWIRRAGTPAIRSALGRLAAKDWAVVARG